MPARFAVGIDLGTTNSVVAWAQLDERADLARVFPIPQLVAPGEVQERSLFPSLLFAPIGSDVSGDPLGDAPWELGEIALRRGAEVPGRLVASSKSWLLHPAVDRTAAILPWGGAEGTPKVSPVEAAERLLRHLRRAWDDHHVDSPLADQDVALTIPASFDEVARELTLEAARRAGFAPRLLEEPQAAFYDWMDRAGPGGIARLLDETGGEALVLVVDVGGGTTDLSLVRLVRVGGVDRVARIAVGPRLLLGGDNMDLALAHAVEGRLATEDGRLDTGRFVQLVAACRGAKELLLGGAVPPLDDAPVAIAGGGSQLVGGARSCRLSRAEVERIVLDGFLPLVEADARPQRSRGALVAFGLPYERDVAITRHLVAFLARHLGPGVWPNAVLLNGGVFRSARVAERLVDALASWRGAEVPRLRDADPDLAVARGAVAYVRARLGRGMRIGGGSARGYFIGVAQEGATGRRAVCVVPRGAEEGDVHVARGRAFALAVGRPVRFELLASDETDARAGDVVDVDDQRFDLLPPLATTLEGTDAQEQRVVIEGELTPLGTLELACVEADAQPPRRFRLAFELRETGLPATGRPAPPPSQPPRRLERALDLVDRAFGKPRGDASGREAKDLLRELERALGARAQWTTDVNRSLFDALLTGARARRRSADHERVFWLLAGWCVRPGYGHPLDPRRVAGLAALFDEKLAFPAEVRGWQQFWVAWRRAAGGLDEATQSKIRGFVDAYLTPQAAGSKRPKKPALSLDDALDMASSLERVSPDRRAALGAWVLERTWTDRDPRLWSAIGRIGARVPTYASVHHVVAPHVAERWLDHLFREKWEAVATAAPAAAQLARLTGDRARDVGERARREVERRLVEIGAPAEQMRVVREVVPLDDGERATFFGDALPLGLRLVQ